MDFSFTEEQTLLQESVSRFMQNDYGFDARQQNAQSEEGFSTACLLYTSPSPRDS